jgi:serine/threonine protein kinase
VIGRRLSHFEILEELGSGGMGEVYRARDVALHRVVALKTLPAAEYDETLRNRLLAEARTASALNHPGIVTIYEVGTDEDVAFIAMELVEGETLAARLRRERPSLETAWRWSVELTDALAAAHRRGIIHRDLKPANIMVTGDDRLKILDFGLAKRFAAEGVREDMPTETELVRTRTGVVMGTPAYMSPEQASGRPVDARTDLFALGAILYELLTGERPFSGESSIELLSAVLRDRPDPPSQRRQGLDPRWDPILRRLLAKDPDARYPGAEDLAADLRELTSGAGPGPIGRHPWLAGTAALVILSFLGIVLTRMHPMGPAVSTKAGAEDSFPNYSFRLLTTASGSQTHPALSPDGRMIAYVSKDDANRPQIWVMDVGGTSSIQITRDAPGATEPVWSATGDDIIFARADGGIWQVPRLGGEPRQLIDHGFAPRLSDDGARLAFNSGRQPWVMSTKEADAKPIPGFESTFFGYLARPEFSPDGTQIVMFWPQEDRPLGDLWIVDLDGDAPPRQLTHIGYLSHSSTPVWSDDGRWILFSSDHAGAVNLWRVSPQGGEAIPVTRGAGSDLSPTLSDDARRLAYTTGRNVARLKVFDPETGDDRMAFQRRDMIIVPELSPDGRYVAFFGRVPGAFQLLVADLATGKERQITFGRGQINTHPRWAADGKTLYFYQEEPTESLRKVSINGGADELVVDDWSWPVQNATRVAPNDELIVYTVRDGSAALDTRVRNLETGEEWSLPLPLYTCRWGANGRTIWGNSAKPQHVYRCPLHGDECERVTAGEDVRLSPDGRAIYFLHGDDMSVWKRELSSGEETRLLTLGDVSFIDFNWGVTPDGKIVHHVQDRGDFELWLGEAVDD